MLTLLCALAMTAAAEQEFVTKLIPHERNTIAIAKQYLKTGKDPQMRKAAERIVKTRQQEVTRLQVWLESHRDDQEAH